MRLVISRRVTPSTAGVFFMPVSKSGRRAAVKRLESLDGIGEVAAAVREVPH